MSVILVLLGFSLLVALIFLFAFIWAVKNGQYDDKYTPSVRILFDDINKQNTPKDLSEKEDNKENNKENN